MKTVRVTLTYLMELEVPDEIIDCLEGGDDTFEFYGDTLSFSEEKLKKAVEGS